jgi:hypothetical protein
LIEHSINAKLDDRTIIKIFDDHWSAAKIGGESGPTERAILFMKTRTKFEDIGRIKSAYICGDESCISLILQIYKIHNSSTCLPPSLLHLHPTCKSEHLCAHSLTERAMYFINTKVSLMLNEKSNFRDCMVRQFSGPCKRSSPG